MFKYKIVCIEYLFNYDDGMAIQNEIFIFLSFMEKW